MSEITHETCIGCGRHLHHWQDATTEGKPYGPRRLWIVHDERQGGDMGATTCSSIHLDDLCQQAGLNCRGKQIYDMGVNN